MAGVARARRRGRAGLSRSPARSAMEKRRKRAVFAAGAQRRFDVGAFPPRFRGLLGGANARSRACALWDYLEQTTSYLSVVELGLYESTVKVYAALAERGIAPHSPEWKAEIEETLERQREGHASAAVSGNAGAQIHLLLSDGPSPRRAQELVSASHRGAAAPDAGARRGGPAIRGHGEADHSGSIGFDDWEWGVDLFAEDPLVFKRLIYEMRFDEVSAVYALFGTFYIGRE